MQFWIFGLQNNALMLVSQQPFAFADFLTHYLRSYDICKYIMISV